MAKNTAEEKLKSELIELKNQKRSTEDHLKAKTSQLLEAGKKIGDLEKRVLLIEPLELKLKDHEIAAKEIKEKVRRLENLKSDSVKSHDQAEKLQEENKAFSEKIKNMDNHIRHLEKIAGKHIGDFPKLPMSGSDMVKTVEKLTTVCKDKDERTVFTRLTMKDGSKFMMTTNYKDEKLESVFLQPMT